MRRKRRASWDDESPAMKAILVAFSLAGAAIRLFAAVASVLTLLVGGVLLFVSPFRIVPALIASPLNPPLWGLLYSWLVLFVLAALLVRAGLRWLTDRRGARIRVR